MIKINAIALAAGIGCDVNDEINDLDELINGGIENADKIKKQYNHISSLLVGMEYVINYTEEEDACEELTALINDLRDTLDAYRRQCMEIIYTKRLGRKVLIKRDTPDTWTLIIGSKDGSEPMDFWGLRDLNAVKNEIEKFIC